MDIQQKPIRILQVFARMDRGGAETMIMNLYRNINRSKVQFDFVVHTTDKCAFDEEIIALGGKIYRVPMYNGRNHVKYKKSWNDLFSKYSEYKIIHAHIRSTSSIFLKIAQKFKITTIAHSHSTSNGSGIIANFKNVLQKNIVTYSDFLLAASEEAGKWLFGSEVIKNDNFFVLNNAIETEKFLYNPKIRVKIRKELGLKDEFMVGHIGSFGKVKNHEFLIDIFESISKKNNNAKLLLVGDGGLRSEIEAKVEKLGLKEKIIFTGIQPNANDFLQAMDVFLMPSLYEGLPVALVEAQASGIQCVISDNITDEVKITNLVDSISLEKSPNYWAEQINKYSTGYHRKDMSKEIINAGYDVKTTAKCLEEFYLKEHYKHQKDN